MMGAARLVVVGDGQVQVAVAVEVRPGHAVTGPVFQEVRRERVREPPAPFVHEEVVLDGGDAGQVGGHDQVGQTVVVGVGPRGRGRVVVLAQGGRIGHVGEGAVAVVAPQDVRAVRGDEEVQIAVVVVVGHRRGHAAVLLAPVRVIHAERGSDIDESPVALVAEEGVLVAVLVGDVDVQVPVPVVVEPHHADGATGVAQARFLGHVGEGPSGSRGRRAASGGVSGSTVASPGVAARTTARRPVVPEHPVGLVPHGDEEVHVAVPVVVDPAGLAGRAHQVHPEAGRDIDEDLVVVAVEAVRNARIHGVADVEIHVPVPVVVAPGRGTGVLGVRQPQLRSHIHEVTGVVAVESVLRVAHPHEEIEIAVAVEVGPGVGLGTGCAEEVGLDAVEGGGESGGGGVAGGRVTSGRNEKAEEEEAHRGAPGWWWSSRIGPAPCWRHLQRSRKSTTSGRWSDWRVSSSPAPNSCRAASDRSAASKTNDRSIWRTAPR